MKKISMLVSACALAALVAGCGGDDEEIHAGTLRALWTIDGTTDPDACAFYAQDPAVGMDFELLVYYGGALIADAHADCRDFVLSLRLDPGVYDGTATMVDPVTDAAISTSLPVDNIDIYEDTTTTIDIDFPGPSFPPI